MKKTRAFSFRTQLQLNISKLKQSMSSLPDFGSTHATPCVDKLSTATKSPSLLPFLTGTKHWKNTSSGPLPHKLFGAGRNAYLS